MIAASHRHDAAVVISRSHQLLTAMTPSPARGFIEHVRHVASSAERKASL